jgi:HAD superfamily hydrolase (TIGR01509 family)
MKLELPAGTFKAYLFDCDGTIADSMPLHYRAWSQALAGWNCCLEERTFYQLGGMPVTEIVALLNQHHGLEMPPLEVARRKEEHYYRILSDLRPVPEVLEQIELSHGQIPFAVVSGSTRESVTASLAALDLLDRFDALVCAGDYTRCKPDPEPFLMAAEKLGVPPSECLVFEDTEIGIRSATAAGMASVRILQPWERAACAATAAP